MQGIEPPIIILGAARSGTSMIARVLGDAPGMVQWYEPNPLWRVGHAYRGHERATPEDAKPWVRRHIRREFDRYQASHGGRRIVEKTPSNALRAAYVHAILPEAKFVHIYRDGRAKLASHLEQYRTFQPFTVHRPEVRDHIRHRLALTPWWEWPAYFPRFLSGAARHYLRGKGISWFGLRYPGWKEDRRGLSQIESIARQWSISIETTLADLGTIPGDSWINIRYEDLVTSPDRWFHRIADFCGIEATNDLVSQVCARVHPESVNKWRQTLDEESLAEAMPQMESTLKRLGYIEKGDPLPRQPINVTPLHRT